MTRQDAVKIGRQTFLALLIVGIATAVGRLLDIDLTAAALLLLVAALLSTLLGRVGAIVGIVGGFLALNYFFTAPRESLDVQKGDELGRIIAAIALVRASTREQSETIAGLPHRNAR